MRQKEKPIYKLFVTIDTFLAQVSSDLARSCCSNQPIITLEFQVSYELSFCFRYKVFILINNPYQDDILLYFPSVLEVSLILDNVHCQNV